MNRNRLRKLALFLATTISASPGMFMTAVSAYAQTASQTVHTFNVPAKPIRQALNDIARIAGISVMFDETPTASGTGNAVTGSMSTSAAISRALAGSGLSWRFTNSSTVTITDPAAGARSATAVSDGSTVLATITVEGTADGTNGIVATRSAIGTKTGASILEVPQAVNVVTRKEMDVRGVTDFNAAVAYTPGIRAIDYPGGAGSPDVYLRGFRAINLAALYRDGLRGGFNQWDTDIEQFAFERMDVLKGPASVLYGEAAPGGLVNMTTKRPSETPVREVQTQYGSHDRKQVGVDLGGPLGNDETLLYRLTGLLRDSGSQIDHATDDRLYLAPSLTFKPSDATHFTILGGYQKTKRGGSQQSIPMDNSIFDRGIHIPSDLYLGVPGVDRYDAENYSLGYEFKHEFDNGWTFNQNARYMRSDVDYISTYIGDYPYQLYQGRYARIGAQNRPKSTNTFMIDSNMRGTVETGPLQHDLLLGLDYSYYDVDERRANSTNRYVIDVLDPVYTGFDFTYAKPIVDLSGKAHQAGLYAQDQIKLDNWVLTLGGRYDWVGSTTTNYWSRTVWGDADETETDRNGAFTGRIGLGYIFDDGLAPYVSYSTSFQPATDVDVNGKPFDPTTGQQWEAGVKYQPADWNGFISASVFQITQQNLTTADPMNIGFSVQDGEVRSRGFEIEAKAELPNGFDITAGYAYTDSRVTKDNENAAGVSKVGSRLQSVPYHQASLWLNYSFQDEALEGLKVGGGVRYVGNSMAAIDTATGQQVKVPGYTLFDAAISYDFGAKNPELKGLALAISGTNLTDEQYYTPGFTPQSLLFGNRRAVNATLSYKW